MSVLRSRFGEQVWKCCELLRSEAIAANGGQRASHARDYRVLRQIALQHPELTSTVWLVLGRDSSTFAWMSGAGHDQGSEPSRSTEVVSWPNY